MTTGSIAHSTHDLADVASLLRLLAEAADSRSFFATLRRALPGLLPATRVDLLASARPDSTYLLLAGEGGSKPPEQAAHNAAGLAEWLAGSGYKAVSTLPLSGAGQHLGWLALARRRGQLEPGELALAGQLAALIALRLLYDQSRDDLATRDEQAAILERRLREQEDMRLRATLAVGAAHDIGNLFASVMGHAQILQHDAPQALQRDLRTIVLAASDGHFLLRRMLAAKTPSSIGTATTQVTLLPALIQDALNLTRPFWEPHPQIAIQTLFGQIPPVRVYAAELREVLINLIINAVSAMPSGGVLTLRSFAVDERVVLEVIDTGRGIAREHQAAIFQPFTTMREGGRGLGLSASRAIIEGYGGTLTVRSAPGQGATFALSLPAMRAHDAPRDAQPLAGRV
jgi:signal transduction histidine kinase